MPERHKSGPVIISEMQNINKRTLKMQSKEDNGPQSTTTDANIEFIMRQDMTTLPGCRPSKMMKS